MNRFASHLLRLMDRVSAPEKVSAHCDIPCGIYDPHAAQVAALTVLRMDQLVKALDRGNADQAAMQVARYTQTKEAHAEICKKELDILWHDYFRPEPSAALTIAQAPRRGGRNREGTRARTRSPGASAGIMLRPSTTKRRTFRRKTTTARMAATNARKRGGPGESGRGRDITAGALWGAQAAG